MTYDPNSRFQVVDIAALAPGESALTRTTEGPFIDTGVQLNRPDAPLWRGRVYIAVSEVREMAEQAGLFDPYVEMVEYEREKNAEAVLQAHGDGYAAGYAQKVDAAADELVERMRARVDRDRQRSALAVAAGDDSAAAPAAGPVAEAAGEPRLDDVPGAEPADGDAAA